MHWDCHRSIDDNISYNRNVIFFLSVETIKAYTGNLNVILDLPLAILAGWQSDRKEQYSVGISWCNNNNNKAAYCRHSFGLGHLSITKIMY